MKPSFKISNKIILILLTAVLPIFMIHNQVIAAPFQLIETESAGLNGKGNVEIKVNYAYEFGYIPVHLNIYRFRFGLFSRFEFGINTNLAYFPDQEDYRVSEVGATMKAHIYKTKHSGVNLFIYGHYRHAFWGSLWKKIVIDVQKSSNKLIRIISPHADEGMDATGGLLMRHSYKIRTKRFYYLLGLSYTFHYNREYEDFNKEQHSEVKFYYSPELHLAKNKLMMALENQFGYWINRGFYYTVVPQIRFEPVQYWCIEIGAVIPAVAADNYRIIGGFTYEFNSKYHKYKKKLKNKKKSKS